MSAHPAQMDEASAPGTGAAIVSPGILPDRINTVLADVLARLLHGDRLTGLPTVVDSSSTRLAHHIYRLGTRYGWHIDRRDRVIGCRDGRVATVVEYWLRADLRAAAAEAGAGAWCQLVRDARAARRAGADQARTMAAELDAATLHQVVP
jgi:hypothetical protein